jgi:hypothetical protein
MFNLMLLKQTITANQIRANMEHAYLEILTIHAAAMMDILGRTVMSVS